MSDTDWIADHLARLHQRLIDQMTEALGLDPDRDDDCVPECQDGPGGSEHLLWHLIQRATARTRPTETTDAQVLAALNAMHPRAAAPSLDYWGSEADKMRTALRAAWTEADRHDNVNLRRERLRYIAERDALAARLAAAEALVDEWEADEGPTPRAYGGWLRAAIEEEPR